MIDSAPLFIVLYEKNTIIRHKDILQQTGTQQVLSIVNISIPLVSRILSINLQRKQHNSQHEIYTST